MMGEPVIRRASGDDLPGILETLRAALGETPLLRRTPELWNWKHVTNPFGPSIILVSELDGRVAGVRAMMRWEMHAPQGHTLHCLRPVDTATHPDYVRRGIFRDLTMAALDEARSEGIHLVFNTPNDKSAPGYLKMGWRTVSRIGALVRPRIGRAVSPFPDTPPSISEVAPDLEPIHDNPPTTIDREPLGLRTSRSEDYMRWRFGSHPTASYGYLADEKGGVAVARASSRGGRSELVVSDLLRPTPGTIHHLARVTRSRYLAGWFSPTAPERVVAIRGGMLPVPKRTLRLVALPLTGLDFDVFDLASWDLATSDLELL